MIPQFVPYWGDLEKSMVLEVLESDYLNEHKTVRLFEQEFAKYVGAKYCVTVTSGTIALYLAVLSRAKTEKFVIPDHDGIFALNASIGAHKNNMICDVDRDGILLQNAYDFGEPIVIHANGRISKNVVMIEDCSQATFHHTPDKISTYSFASTKHMTTSGQGGAICCDDKNLFDLLTRLKDHGRNDRQSLKPMSDNYDQWGMNFKFTEIQAAFGLAQLKSMPERMESLKMITDIYYDSLNGIEGLIIPETYPGWYVDIYVYDPEKIKTVLNRYDISVRRFPRPLHLQQATRGIHKPYECISSIHRYNHGLYLPSTTNLTHVEVEKIVNIIRREVKNL